MKTLPQGPYGPDVWTSGQTSPTYQPATYLQPPDARLRFALELIQDLDDIQAIHKIVAKALGK